MAGNKRDMYICMLRISASIFLVYSVPSHQTTCHIPLSYCSTKRVNPVMVLMFSHQIICLNFYVYREILGNQVNVYMHSQIVIFLIFTSKLVL